jgi:hypothetical protein
MRAAILAAASVMTASSALATAFRHFSKYLLLKQSLVEWIYIIKVWYGLVVVILVRKVLRDTYR